MGMALTTTEVEHYFVRDGAGAVVGDTRATATLFLLWLHNCHVHRLGNMSKLLDDHNPGCETAYVCEAYVCEGRQWMRADGGGVGWIGGRPTTEAPK
ncbi:hypothetical protein SAMD00023353_0201830 [Rosellinia necatrix]|uniref:Uncharacterized protein n=1 Tax=Rosellinia necatrix TaxID=77044 RepID=A0A1S8A5I6_ROSNE|nr:hypothetical protein SAMD00023353_0201830 [Rosellinia necatrix]